MSPAPEPPLPAERFAELLEGRAPDFGVALESGRRTLLAHYLAELDRWRQSANLTGRLAPAALVDHALEALVASPWIAQGERVVDIGSGAGFPGMPLAIYRPDVELTLVEPRGKRAAFLRHVARTLGLSNASVSESRIEKVGGQTFDAATTRAVGGFEDWIGDARFLRSRGRLLAWTTDSTAVLRSLAPLFRLEDEVSVPGSRARKVAVFARVG